MWTVLDSTLFIRAGNVALVANHVVVKDDHTLALRTAPRVLHAIQQPTVQDLAHGVHVVGIDQIGQLKDKNLHNTLKMVEVEKQMENRDTGEQEHP